MALRDVKIEWETITFAGGSFAVHGITPEIIRLMLSAGHRENMQKAMDFVEAQLTPTGDIKMDESDLVGIMAQVVTDFPLELARLISYCAEEEDQFETVKNLPVTVQLEAAIAIARLTFDGEDSIKKFVANLITIVVQIRRGGIPVMNAIGEKLTGTKS